jgi:uncharacterized repeat protein (TIGR01451 family)
MRNTINCAGTKAALHLTTFIIAIAFAVILPFQSIAQCVAVTGNIEGYVYSDKNSNGVRNAEDEGIANVLVNAYDQNGTLVGFSLTNGSGLFTIGNLQDGKKVRLVFSHSSDYYSSYMGTNNGTTVQFVQVPVCSVALGLLSDTYFCNSETQIVTTCFVQGDTDENADEPTIVSMKYGFDLVSPVTKYASHSETGSIWGIAWKNDTKEIFSAAFIKQYAGLTEHGHDAIFKTSIGSSPYKTSLFVRLSDLGLETGKLTSEDIDECNFGEQVGKIGLGALITSPDEKYLYTVNLYNNTLVRLSSVVPTPATTSVWNIPNPGCSHGEYRAFALKYYNDKVYVGVTCTAETAKSATSSSANVYEFDPGKGTFSLVFTTNYIKGFWYDYPANGLTQQHWLTDIDFTDDGNMLLSLTDRIGHRYCRAETNRLDEQKPDLLMVWNDNGVWRLENNGQAGPLTGSGVGNGQGPGGGEFFGHDFWITNPAYHSEIALGSIFVMPGSGSVVAAVFDPNTNAYSGGFHRYSTRNGQKEGAIELYTRNTETAFGKATGFGDLIALCGPPAIEIGNLVWIDKNNNGIQDANEEGVEGLTLRLFNDECELIGTVDTDAKGNYAFNQSNVSGGLLPGTKYFIGLDKNQMDPLTGQFLIGGEYYNLAKTKVGDVMTDNNGNMGDMPCDMLVFEVIANRINHNFDLGFAPSGECDLLLSMELINDKAYHIDDIVSFEVTLSNRGTAILSDIEITGKIPDGFQWIPDLNPSWVNVNNTVKFVVDGNLNANSSESILIHFKAIKGSQYIDFTHSFEISSVNDRDGSLIQDFSYCFANAQNRTTSQTLSVFDLALMHKLDAEDYFVPGSQVKINTIVYNQGNVVAEEFEIINYLNPELDFNPLLNPGWEISQDLKTITFTESKQLLPGESRTFMIILNIKEDVEINQIINFAEILSSLGSGGFKDADFDSVPDDDVSNDVGGEVGKGTDNMITDHGIIDEDDHDPVLIQIESVDISLTKTTPFRRVKAGDKVYFYIDIQNEGSVILDNVKLIDYIPAKLILNDPNWTKTGNNAELVVHFSDGFRPGQTHRELIHFIVAPEATPAQLINAAEVVEYTDENGRIVSDLDTDSFADNIRGNDSFNPNDKGNREDDYDEAFLFVIETSIETKCLNNASNLTDGQCESVIEILSGSDETWIIDQVNGLFTPASPNPPAAPIAYIAGFELDEEVKQFGISAYTIKGKFTGSQGFSIRLRNNFGDLEDFVVNTGCLYTPVIISGPRSLCTGGSATYSIPSVPGVDYYVWTVNDILTGSNSNTITINWNDYGPGTHTVKVVLEFEDEATGCYTPGIATVVVGAADLSAIACIGDFNVSLNGNCELFVTPSMLIAGSFNSSAPYIVMLKDKNGNPIPDARLTYEHLGTKVMAKLIEGCGGNSCWSTITVEDKIAPVSLCQNITLPCYKLEQYNGPFETDNCGGHVENILLNETISKVDCQAGPSPYIKYIDRVYQAVDESGNKSAICSMRITVERPDFSLITWPADKTMQNNSVFVCGNFEMDENGMPAPKVAGIPFLANLPLYPQVLEVCNLYTGYTDYDLGKIGCVRKIRRAWMVYEHWCSSGQLVFHNQMLEITDNLAPEIDPINDISVSASFSNCMARVNLPVPVVTDECEGVLSVDITYPGGFFKNQYGGQIDLPVGVHTITYTAYDECLNSSFITFKVTVEDKTPPVVICKGEVVVSLNFLGEAYLYPHHINDGSYDACGIDSMRLARMGDLVNGEIPDDQFKKSIDFDCDDAGERIMVALKVWDTSGNSNTCMMTVEVQDKFPPQISCPPHVTIFCDDHFDLNDLSPYGTATAIDACGASVRELPAVSTLNACRVGKIERTFIATDNLGIASCKQYITVIERTPFNPETDVTKSINFEVTDKCSKDDLLPENLEGLKGAPIIREGICNLASASYSDQVFTIVSGACYKIVRTWTVIDWCAMDGNPEYEPYVFQQTIAVKKTFPPYFTSEIRDTTICTAPGNCDQGLVTLRATGKDSCTADNQLRWKYIIFIDNDADDKIEDSGLGAVININLFIKTGTHRIQYIFEDACGNLIVKDQMVTVTNCDGPKAVSLQRIAVGLVPWDRDGDGIPDIEKACIYASSLNASSYHPCNLPIRFSFSPDVNDTIRCYDCFNIGIVIDTFWVTDINGKQDWVTFEVDVQDNNDSDVCVNICIINAPNAAITGGDNSCSGDPVTLTASGGDSYIWSTGATTASITVSPESTTTYVVTVTGEIGCTATAQRVVNVLPRPNVIISGENICNGVSTTLTASGAVSYIWNTGATTPSITVAPPATTTYTVTATGANGCTAVATRTVGVSSTPIVNISGPSTNCPGASMTLTASGGSSYVWSTGALTASITVAPSVNTTYIVTVTDQNGCTASSSRLVTILPTPNVNITGDNSICFGDATTLTATGGVSYLWSTGAISASITVIPLVNTTYTVTATAANGCTSSASRTVTINELPGLEISGDDVLCIGESTSLVANGGVSYLWSTGATTSEIIVSPLVTTTYSVTATDANGCAGVTSILVTVNPLPVVSISGDSLICNGEVTVITASGGIIYSWNTRQTGASITVGPGSYTVTATDVNGCLSTASVNVTIVSEPEVIITGGTEICEGETVALTASGASTYLWSTGQTMSSISVSPLTTTIYTVTGTDLNGCTDVASATVIVNSAELICETQDITVYLDAILGEVMITPDQISIGNGNCGDNIVLSVIPNKFFCNDAADGQRIVTLTVKNTLTQDSLTCEATVTVLDTIRPTLVCPPNLTLSCDDFDPSADLSVYGTALINDNCTAGLITQEIPIRNLNTCDAGTITRTFTAQDVSGNFSQCVQLITIQGVNPIDLTEITFPSDITVNSCTETNPDFTGNTVVNLDGADCANVVITFSDLEVTPVCKDTIFRTWTVVDSCQLISGTNSGIFNFTQTIVVDLGPPVIVGPQDTLINVGIQDCMAQLNGVFHTVSGCNVVIDNNSGMNPGTFDVSGFYTVGNTTFVFTATELCNNETTTFEFDITVEDETTTNLDCIKQFPVINDMLVALDPVSNHAVIEVDCGDNFSIFPSYSNTDINDTLRIYTCDQILADYPITVYFWSNGVVIDSCESLATPIDGPQRFCSGGRPELKGQIVTESLEPVRSVEINLSGSGMPLYMSDAQGRYDFGAMDAGGTYDVIPSKDINPLEGVSTLDLILIQRHVLGLDRLNSPYKMIAADVNNDGRISAADILQLRKLLLGIFDRFPENTSWQMVDKGYSFPVPEDPFITPYPEQYHIESLNTSMRVDFVGVKTGDVNGSYTSNVTSKQSELRKGNQYLLAINDAFVGNDSHEIPVFAVHGATVTGMQIALALNGISDLEIKPGALKIEDIHYHFANGYLLISWHNSAAVYVNEGDKLFTIHMDNQKAAKLSDIISIDKTVRSPEWYNKELEIRNADIAWGKFNITEEGFEVIGNTPNPWNNETFINFYIPTEGQVRLKLRDMTGKLVLDRKQVFGKGKNHFTIQSSDIPVSGLLIYELQFKDEVRTLKMLNIR